ncbi:MAG: hypothetical protein ACNYWU_02145 [Desulfobacterales bacterium]
MKENAESSMNTGNNPCDLVHNVNSLLKGQGIDGYKHIKNRGR